MYNKYLKLYKNKIELSIRKLAQSLKLIISYNESPIKRKTFIISETCFYLILSQYKTTFLKENYFFIVIIFKFFTYVLIIIQILFQSIKIKSYNFISI